MFTKDDQDAVTTALTAELTQDVNQFVPGWAKGMIPAGTAPHLAARCAFVALDTLNKRASK